MIRAVLMRGDGLSSGRPWLSTLVRNVQQALIDAGFDLNPDGRFGSKTQRAVKEFQSQHRLEASGVLDRLSWTSLSRHLDAVMEAKTAHVEEFLANFSGDLDWIHEWESHAGRPYWPEGRSGVTLDPGVDLGHAAWSLVEELYKSRLTVAQLRALQSVSGIKGEDARTALNSLPIVRSIRISRQEAAEIMPYAARPYWNGITRRFRALTRVDTPPSVQTALLSLAYNRGVFNHHLAKLGEPLQAKQWQETADIIGSMQQSHSQKGIRRRRRYEGHLIRAELEFLES